MGERQRKLEAIALCERMNLLTGDGSYARNLFMVLICANDPPAEAGFCFNRSQSAALRA
jgi:hypothetical protein